MLNYISLADKTQDKTRNGKLWGEEKVDKIAYRASLVPWEKETLNKNPIKRKKIR